MRSQKRRSLCEALDARRLFAVDISIVSIVPESPYFDPHALLPTINYTVTFRNNLASSYSYAGLDLVGGDVVLSRDHILGNDDDVTESGSIYPLIMQGHQTISNHDGFLVLGALEPGDYFIGSHFKNIDGTTHSTRTQEFITPHAVITVLADTPTISNTIIGSAGNDIILINQTSDATYVTQAGVTSKTANSTGTLFINGGTGNDKIVANDSVTRRLEVTGGGGNDTIVGGGVADELSGANGKDKVYGGAGNDYLLGGASGDFLAGEAGSDTMSGAGGNDRLSDLSSSNSFYGGAGNDVFIARDGLDLDETFDVISGGLGNDSGQTDINDLGRETLEILLA